MLYTTKIWIILLLLTLFAFLLGWFHLLSKFSFMLLGITTFIKGQLVIESFMGLSEVELKYRIIPTLWLLITISLIGGAYYL